MEKIKTIPFTQRMPEPLVKLVDDEASRERRSRTEQINRILEERYGLLSQVEEKVAEEVAR